MCDEEKAECFNCSGQGVVPDMDWIKDATEEELNDPDTSCWLECPECQGTGEC